MLHDHEIHGLDGISAAQGGDVLELERRAGGEDTSDAGRAAAKKLELKAIETLGELLACRGRQSMVAASAATALYKIANPEVTKERLQQMLEELIADAERSKGSGPSRTG